jgi:hypothetical protein
MRRCGVVARRESGAFKLVGFSWIPESGPLYPSPPTFGSCLHWHWHWQCLPGQRTWTFWRYVRRRRFWLPPPRWPGLWSRLSGDLLARTPSTHGRGRAGSLSRRWGSRCRPFFLAGTLRRTRQTVPPPSPPFGYWYECFAAARVVGDQAPCTGWGIREIHRAKYQFNVEPVWGIGSFRKRCPDGLSFHLGCFATSAGSVTTWEQWCCSFIHRP